MPRPFQPTVRHLTPPPRGALARLAVGSLLAVAALFAVPSMASAASTCTYNESSKVVTVVDHSGTNDLRIARGFGFASSFVIVLDGSPTTTYCFGPTTAATINNTDEIRVKANPTDEYDDILIDNTRGLLGPGATPEADALSEIEVKIDLPSDTSRFGVGVGGTDQDDVLKAGDVNTVMIGRDADVDVIWFGPSGTRLAPRRIMLAGLGGADLLSGQGGFPFGPPSKAAVSLDLYGGDGPDRLIGGTMRDHMEGGDDNDTFYTVDGKQDIANGLGGVDTAKVDVNDGTPGVEYVTVMQ